ncbi:hypothetical protein LX36DRAFT_722332 [Colletotrichum falcatum]|nr:hypothetical protein LX36DRAFT_722332 [Colletotrichum falcatum]
MSDVGPPSMNATVRHVANDESSTAEANNLAIAAAGSEDEEHGTPDALIVQYLLALGLERPSPGGTMVVLFHKVEAWTTVVQLHRFGRFSKVRLFKPARGHAKRSSFYMVAEDVRSRDPEALVAIETWKKTWQAATFDLEGNGAALRGLDAEEPSPEQILHEFGEDLVRLGRRAWAIQAKALRNAPFIAGR